MADKTDIIFINHILDSIAAIKSFSLDLTKEELASNRLKQSAIVREIEVIGEAVKNLSDTLKNNHKEIEWKEIIGTRDKMIHHYFGLDLNVIWLIIQNDLPVLKDKLEKIKKSMN